MSVPPDPNHTDDSLRPHSYDGIQEYDKRLPNWWLFTLYGAIAFSVVYWLYYHLTDVGLPDQAVFRLEMETVQAARLANSMGTLDDAQFWEMSRNSQIVAAGKAVFTTNCVSCHLPSLRGKDELPTMVGPNLVDEVWIHGNRPVTLREVVMAGVPVKGMPQWGPLLGDRKVVEAVAYILSHHEPPAAGSAAP